MARNCKSQPPRNLSGMHLKQTGLCIPGFPQCTHQLKVERGEQLIRDQQKMDHSSGQQIQN